MEFLRLAAGFTTSHGYDERISTTSYGGSAIAIAIEDFSLRYVAGLRRCYQVWSASSGLIALVRNPLRCPFVVGLT